jgi:hypothetical protein
VNLSCNNFYLNFNIWYYTYVCWLYSRFTKDHSSWSWSINPFPRWFCHRVSKNREIPSPPLSSVQEIKFCLPIHVPSSIWMKSYHPRSRPHSCAGIDPSLLCPAWMSLMGGGGVGRTSCCACLQCPWSRGTKIVW